MIAGNVNCMTCNILLTFRFQTPLPYVPYAGGFCYSTTILTHSPKHPLLHIGWEIILRDF